MPYVSRALHLTKRRRAHFSSTGGDAPPPDASSIGGRPCEDSEVRTIQLRRYTLVDGEYDAFVAWWQTWMPKVRAAGGFVIDFAYGLRETNEFIWAVSAEGDEDAFLAREAEYLASDARGEAFAGLPQRVAVYNVRFVDDSFV